MAEFEVLLSIHDVMPETLAPVREMLRKLEASGLAPVTLLVVPGRNWNPPDIQQLRDWSARGHPIAAHGWRHEVRSIRGWRHRLHSTLISRRVAEHMELDSTGILDLMRRSVGWLLEQGLPDPFLYVPPAWALGGIRRSELQSAPCPAIEVLGGVIRTADGSLHRLPLLGFETDTAFRAASVRLWNRWQMLRARSSGRLLRIGLHPGDFHLRLADDLARLLQWKLACRRYDALPGFAEPPG